MIPWFLGPDLLRAFVLVALGMIVFQLARHRSMQRPILWIVVGVLAAGVLYSFADLLSDLICHVRFRVFKNPA